MSRDVKHLSSQMIYMMLCYVSQVQISGKSGSRNLVEITELYR